MMGRAKEPVKLGTVPQQQCIGLGPAVDGSFAKICVTKHFRSEREQLHVLIIRLRCSRNASMRQRAWHEPR
jgi:hypothetical protein